VHLGIAGLVHPGVVVAELLESSFTAHFIIVKAASFLAGVAVINFYPTFFDTHVIESVTAIFRDGEFGLGACPFVASLHIGKMGAGFGDLPSTAFTDIVAVCRAVMGLSAVHAGGKGTSLCYEAFVVRNVVAGFNCTGATVV
jgi:hypothetical protein